MNASRLSSILHLCVSLVYKWTIISIFQRVSFVFVDATNLDFPGQIDFELNLFKILINPEPTKFTTFHFVWTRIKLNEIEYNLNEYSHNMVCRFRNLKFMVTVQQHKYEHDNYNQGQFEYMRDSGK